MKRLMSFFWRYIASPKQLAKHLGVKMGNNVNISTRNWPSEAYLISIGNNVQITDNVFFFTHGGCHVCRKEHPNFDFFGCITIEDWVYIGANAMIMPGVTVREHTLVAAGSVVTKSFPPRSVIGGNPARILCSIDEFYSKNERYNVDTFDKSFADKKVFLVSLDHEKFVRK